VAEGVTEIRNAYITPEIEDLIIFLQRMGANIRSFGNSLIRIEGNSGLLRGVSYSVMLDRIEALTWIVFTAITKGNVIIEGIPFQEMEVPLLHLKNAGIEYFQNRNSIYIVPDCFPPQGIQPFEIACGTYPGVVSDMQPFFVLLGIKANGLSRVFDYRYPERMAYAKELDTFNPGSILAEPGKITIKGSDKLYGATVQSTDLRGSMTMVMAAFNAKGCSVVKNVQMAMRGYNNLTSKLRNLGLTFEVVER
jgi:UDP-N-acetylglucosamine 1-carboxyvinyltransferase